MKKFILLCLALVLLSGCAPSAAVDTAGWQNYQNTYYSFQISYPEDYSYCLNSYCINSIPEDALSTFTLLDAAGDSVLSIQPYYNALGLTAVEYGAKAAAYNDYVYDEESTVFAGQEAFSFMTGGSFYEPGGVSGITEDGHMSLQYNETAIQIPFVELSEVSQVIYADYGDYFYRITYSDNEDAQAIAESFEFLE